MATDPIGRLVDRVEERLDAIVSTSVERYFTQVSAYAASPDARLRDDATRHTRAVFEAVLITLREGRPARPDDFGFTAEQATRRLHSGLQLSDFLAGFRTGQVTLWEGIVSAAAADHDLREASIGVATHLMQVIEVGSAMAADAFLVAQQAELADSDRILRDLMEDLLAGRLPTAGPKQALAAAAGLEPEASVMVVIAMPTAPLRTGQSLRSALGTVRLTMGIGTRGIAVLRQEQIVGVLPVSGAGSSVVSGLQRAQRHLEAHGIALAVGTSTLQSGPTGVPDAYREARIACESLGGKPGVSALSMLSTLDYMVLRKDATTLRLIKPELRQFVESDLARDGGLIQTLLMYVGCDLNAKTAAERLHIHVNTAYYRLERIAERTGCDLRSFADLEELLIAIRLLRTPPTQE